MQWWNEFIVVVLLMFWYLVLKYGRTKSWFPKLRDARPFTDDLKDFGDGDLLIMKQGKRVTSGHCGLVVEIVAPYRQLMFWHLDRESNTNNLIPLHYYLTKKSKKKKSEIHVFHLEKAEQYKRKMISATCAKFFDSGYSYSTVVQYCMDKFARWFGLPKMRMIMSGRFYCTEVVLLVLLESGILGDIPDCRKRIVCPKEILSRPSILQNHCSVGYRYRDSVIYKFQK